MQNVHPAVCFSTASFSSLLLPNIFETGCCHQIQNELIFFRKSKISYIQHLVSPVLCCNQNIGSWYLLIIAFSFSFIWHSTSTFLELQLCIKGSMSPKPALYNLVIATCQRWQTSLLMCTLCQVETGIGSCLTIPTFTLAFFLCITCVYISGPT